MGRAFVFIDGGYMRHVLRQFGEPRINYEALSDLLCEGEERIRTYYYDSLPYVGPDAGREEQEKLSRMERFLETVEGLPRFEVRLGRVVRRPSGGGEERFEQKRVDVMMALDLARLSWSGKMDVAVLVTGDDDLVPAVEEAKRQGVVVRLCYSALTVSPDMLKACDEVVEFDQSMLERIRLR